MNTAVLLSIIIIVLLIALAQAYIKIVKLKREYGNSININNIFIEMSNNISQYKDVNELYDKMLEYTIKLIDGAQYGSIQIYNKFTDFMEFKALAGYNTNELTTIHIRKEELFLYSLNKLEKPGIIVNPLLHDKHLYKPYENEILKNSKQLLYKSVLSAPLYIDGEFFGCISVDNIVSPTAFSKKDIEIIKYISVHLEIVIKNMLLVNNMKQRLVTDSLTGLFNRRYYTSMVESNFNHGELSSTAFIMIDMDNFKAINDTYGHIKGDEALKYFSDLLKSKFRKGDTIIRYAGDEFLLLLNDCDEQDAERILIGIKEDLRKNSFQGIKIEFSYGISRLEAGASIEEAIEHADRNMYFQKSEKKQSRARLTEQEVHNASDK